MTRRRKPVEDWRGQIGMDVGEQRQRSELEGSVQKRIVETLEAHGVDVYRHNVFAMKLGKRFVRCGRKGDADLWCFLPGGVVFFVETKRAKGGVITDEQRAFVAKKRAQGFVAGFATSPAEALELLAEARNTARRAA